MRLLAAFAGFGLFLLGAQALNTAGPMFMVIGAAIFCISISGVKENK